MLTMLTVQAQLDRLAGGGDIRDARARSAIAADCPICPYGPFYGLLGHAIRRVKPSHFYRVPIEPNGREALC
jgi:hypothetical protein